MLVVTTYGTTHQRIAAELTDLVRLLEAADLKSPTDLCFPLNPTG